VGEMLNDDLAFISHEHFVSLPRNHCKPGDVIIGTLGDPNLRACIIPDELKNSLNKADCLLLRVNNGKALSSYACWLLNFPATVTKALELVRGQTRGRISLGRLKELEVPLPPLDLQCRFAAIVEAVERQKALQRAHLTELDTLFAALQQRAFTGEL
jgi:type I restriction enzyme S subunit